MATNRDPNLEVTWSDKPNDESKKRLEEWYKNLPPEQRRAHSKETFDETVIRASQPEPASPETKVRPAGYNAKRTR